MPNANILPRTRVCLLAILIVSTILLRGGLDVAQARTTNRSQRDTAAPHAKARHSSRRSCRSARHRLSKHACSKSKRAAGMLRSSRSGALVAKPGSAEGGSFFVQSAPSSGVLTSQASSGPASGSATSGGASSPSSSSEGGYSSPEGGSSSSEGGSGSPEGPNPPEPSAPFHFFAATSFWNEPLPANAPLDSESTALIGKFDADVAAEQTAADGPWINTTSYSIPIYTVPADKPTVMVKLVDHAPVTALSSAWSAVPLPPNAKPAAGTDGALVIWQPSTDRLWEFWRLAHDAEGWHAWWGGAMQHASSNPGVYDAEAWPGAVPWWGTSASSLSLAGGLITLEDLERGEINHALELAIPERRAGIYASPAHRSDGKSSNPLSLPEGAHLRLNPNLNLAALHLPHLTLMIAEAAQRYGIFLTDGSGVIAFDAQDPIPTGAEPYAGPSGYFEGKHPNKLLASFPWSELELLKMELHSQS